MQGFKIFITSCLVLPKFGVSCLMPQRNFNHALIDVVGKYFFIYGNSVIDFSNML